MHNHTVVHSLDLTFLALSDPIRRSILARLRTGPATANELAAPFGVTQQAVSKHLAYLSRAHLIDKQKQGRNQVCTLSATSLKAASQWLDDYRQYWSEAFDRLDELLVDLQKNRATKGKKHVTTRKER